MSRHTDPEFWSSMRRVKCDEQRPVCNACTRLGYVCVYYNSTSGALAGTSTLSASKSPAAGKGAPDPYSVPNGMLTPLENQSEWQFYQMFQNVHMKWFMNAPCEDDGLCTLIWTNLILPLMHVQALFKHLVLAVSAAQTFGNPDGTPAGGYFGAAAVNEPFFLYHYGKVLRLTMEAKERGDISAVICAASCLCVVEACRHRPKELIAHLTSALRLIRQMDSVQPESLTVPHSYIDTIVKPTMYTMDKNRHWLLETISAIQIR
jgi:hypothetical protein